MAPPVIDADLDQGLTAAQVAERVASGAVNVAPDQRSRSLTDIIRANTLTSFNLVIAALWALMIFARAPFQDTLFGVVIVVNSAIGIIQDYRAKRTLERLNLVGEARPLVRRDGEDVELRPTELVRDDLVVLRTGDQVVVDGDVLKSLGLEIDESLLTGEADPVDKVVGDAAMSGSFVVAGSGVMRATSVGLESYATRLTSEARKFTTTKSELMISIMRFVRVMTVVIVPVGILLFVSQIRASDNWQTALTGTVAGVVTMIPEGLVLLTSVAMAVAVVRLGARRALVQEMPAVETLARVDVICVDKTGTLTEPGMHVNDVVILDEAAPVDAVLGAIGAAESAPNPTVMAVAQAYPAPGWDVLDSIAFSSARKWSAVQFEEHGWWLIGAPEILLDPTDDVRRQASALAGLGARVLVLACPADTGNTPTTDGAGSVLAVALVVIDQRLRSDAPDTVAYFLDQGVTVKVISGDNPLTVGAIARQAGIPGGDEPFDANELPEDRDALADLLESRGVFGRVTPAQKRAMVGALQSRGHVVAMTGDGVNDVLALKDADLGIAMGSGAGATRAVAQLVLLDDQFSVMPSVVAEGRRVLGNIERVSDLFLTKSFYSLVLAVMTGIATLPFPFLPRHLTLVTALTIGTPGFLLALMPNTQRFVPGFFRRVLSFTIPAGAVIAGLSFASYHLALTHGAGVNEARVSATLTLFVCSWSVLVLVARPLDRIRWLIVGSMAVGFLLALSINGLANFFAITITSTEYGVIGVAFGIAGALLLVVVHHLANRWRAISEPKSSSQAVEIGS